MKGVYTMHTKKKKIKVLVFDTWDGERLEETLNNMIEDDYIIQDSTVEFYQSTVSGVYVFKLNEDNTTDQYIRKLK